MSRNTKKTGEKSFKKQPEKTPELSADELRNLVVDEALLLAHHKKFHINDLTRLALKYEELVTTP